MRCVSQQADTTQTGQAPRLLESGCTAPAGLGRVIVERSDPNQARRSGLKLCLGPETCGAACLA